LLGSSAVLPAVPVLCAARSVRRTGRRRIHSDGRFRMEQRLFRQYVAASCAVYASRFLSLTYDALALFALCCRVQV
jgi:hypothetical protein